MSEDTFKMWIYIILAGVAGAMLHYGSNGIGNFELTNSTKILTFGVFSFCVLLAGVYALASYNNKYRL